MENTTKTPMSELLELLLLAARKEALKKATLSKPTDEAVAQTVLRPKRIGDKAVLQAESFMKDNKAIHKNIEQTDRDALSFLLSRYRQVNVMTTAGDCEYRVSKSGKTVLLGGKALFAKLGGEVQKVKPQGNDQKKDHILHGDEPFLKLLGVSDQNGRVLDKKRSKFRQINRFLEHIRDIVRYLPAEGTLHVCDLCCGKSYLSFAAYHYLRNVLGRDVDMMGVDLKSDVIAYCSDVASMLSFDTLHFLCADITAFTPKERPHLVISLHACDTATDIVLGKAMEWGAKVILSTPCCHHELNHTINCETLSFITDYSMLRQKLCDAATDALRLKLLEANGYSTDALELIDPEETPKNILLRAIKQKANPAREEKAMKEYRKAKAFLLGLDEDAL